MKLIKRNLPPLLLSGVLAIAWWLHPLPFEPSDLWGYSKRAQAIFAGLGEGEVIRTSSINTHIFGQRLSVYLPIGIIYSITGVSMEATTVWPLAAMVGMVWGLWCSRAVLPERLISCLLLVSSLPFFLQFRTLRPDIFVALSCLLFFLLVERRDRNSCGPVSSILLMAAILYFGLFAKLSIYWAGVVWIVVAVGDLYGNRWEEKKQFHLSVVVAGLVALGAYLATCQAIWGNPLARFDAIKSVSGSHLWSWGTKSLLEKIRRLTYGPFLTFTMGYGPVFPLAIGGICVWRKEAKFWHKTLLVMLVLFWFGTTSVSLYEPLPTMSRMILPVLPPMCIVAASFAWNDLLSRSPINSRQVIAFSVVFVLSAANIVGNVGSEVQWMSSGLALAAIVFRLAPSMRISRWEGMGKWSNVNTSVVALALAVSITVTPLARFAKTVSNPDTEELVVDQIKSYLPENNVMLFTGDQRTPRSLKFYYDYSYPPALSVSYAGGMDQLSKVCKDDDARGENRMVLFMQKEDMSNFLNTAYGKEHVATDEIRQLISGKLFRRNGIALYRLCRGSVEG